MAFQQAAMREDQARGLGRLVRGPREWPLLAQPAPLIAYIIAVGACYFGLIGWELAKVRPRAGELLLFGALLACGAVCIEATRRLGMPAGVSRDLLSAWWLPIALLLPPVYALVAPLLLTALMQVRVRRSPVYRRLFSAAALGLSGAAASIVFGRFGLGVSTARVLAAWFSSAGPQAWFTRPATVGIAIGCAALFSVLNAALVAIAAHAAEPLVRWRDVLWDAESLTLDVTEICVGLLVAIACVLSPLLLIVALPPVILLQRSLLHQQLRAAARTDAKTGLLNAAAWQREADTEISRVLRARQPLALLLMDIDHFKRVNDTHGHLAGDQVLTALADVLRQQVRETDVVGRFGGEEFVVLLPGADTAEAIKIAERLRAQVGATVTSAAGVEVTVTVSIGAALLGQHGDELRALLTAADLALYRAKRAGRNQVCLSDGAGSYVPAQDCGGPAAETILRAGESAS
ncbi:MAG TPA: GGDEF domain-containing protein [Streptosporangiaceae bacterium]|nr:GGDEF domain-containing protein [Streptosporangiaceae bacterium]